MTKLVLQGRSRRQKAKEIPSSTGVEALCGAENTDLQAPRWVTGQHLGLGLEERWLFSDENVLFNRMASEESGGQGQIVSNMPVVLSRDDELR